MPSSLPWHRFKAAVKGALTGTEDPSGFRKAASDAGGYDNLGTVVDEARQGGPTAESIKFVPPPDLSKIDRYAHGANAYQMLPPVFRDTIGPVTTGGLGAVHELSKFLPAYFGNVVAAGTDPSYAHDSNTSKPSLGNWLNLMRGYGDAQIENWRGRKPPSP